MGIRTGLGMSVATSAGDPIVFVFTGESNAGGTALNSSASAPELAARPLLKILNNTTLVFESLDIGTNNLIDHDELVATTTTHGWELALANEIEAGNILAGGPKYLIKTGQGGSSIAEWAAEGAYWTKFLERTDAAKELLKPTARWIVFYSQGLNDSGVPNAVATWKTATLAHLAKIRVQLPGCVFVMTEFQGLLAARTDYNTAIQEIAAAAADVASVTGVGLANDGGNHWSYAGLKAQVTAMLAALPYGPL